MRVFIVINPIAGDTDKAPLANLLRQELKNKGHEFDMFYTTGINDDMKLQVSIAHFQPDRIILLGGDGTLLQVAQNILYRPIDVALIPMGSANGMSVELNIPKDPEEAIDIALNSKRTRPIDLIRVNQKYFGIHIGDVGINAQLIESYEQDEERGMITYAKHALPNIRNSKEIAFSIIADGKIYERKGYMLAFANAQKYGTGVILNPKGDLSDGLFELCLVKDISFDAMISAGMTVIDASFFNEEYTEVISCQQAHVKLQKPHVLQIDGELIGKFDEIDIEAIPRAINVIVPEEAQKD